MSDATLPPDPYETRTLPPSGSASATNADKCKALQRPVLHAEIEASLAGRPNKQRFREVAGRLLDLAT